jgi:hypothetical protein
VVICFLMALGFLATAATIPKMVSVAKYGFHGDTTYRASDALLWSLLEVNLGIIAACVPTLRGPFERGLKSWGLINSCQSESKPTGAGSPLRKHQRWLSPPRSIEPYRIPKNDGHDFTPPNEKHRTEKPWLELSTD